MSQMLTETAAAAGFAGEVATADDAWLLGHDVRYWAGPRSLPLWLPVADAGLARRSNAAYLAAGGHLRPLTATITRVLEDEAVRGVRRNRRSGLSPADEAELLAELAQPSQH